MGDLQTLKSHLNTDDERVRDFQRKLYRKAKQEEEFRFYVLYDKVRLPYFLREAYRRCKCNHGVCGIDGMSFEDVEEYGVDKFLSEIMEELLNRTYKPSPVLRVYIPKANGKERPLGIPTIKDRVVQMSVKMVIEPIFEADFEDCSYGYRPKRSSGEAVKQIKKNLQEGKTDVLDADLSAYFDSIPHKELLQLIGRRISDRNVLHLIKMWLKVPVVENGRTYGGRKNRYGTPQGGVISPLLANIYLNGLDKAVCRQAGVFRCNKVGIVRYADDFILMAKRITPECVKYLQQLLKRMKLTLNTEKTRRINARKTAFDFLGHTFRYSKDLYGRDCKYWCVEPSKKAKKRLCSSIRNYLNKNGFCNPTEVVKGLNLKLKGWINYFTIEGVTYPTKAKRDIRYYLFKKLQRYYKRKSQRKSKLYRQGAFKVLVERYGLIDPTKYPLRRLPVKA